MPDKHAPGERVLTEPQRAYVEQWLRTTADLMGLRDWMVRASAYIAHDDAIASSFVRDRADETEVGVGRDFATNSSDEQRATLVHELLHPHFYRVTRLAFELIESELGKRTEAVIEAAVRSVEELTIERLARAIAPLFPTVELPAGKPPEPKP